MQVIELTAKIVNNHFGAGVLLRSFIVFLLAVTIGVEFAVDASLATQTSVQDNSYTSEALKVQSGESIERLLRRHGFTSENVKSVLSSKWHKTGGRLIEGSQYLVINYGSSDYLDIKLFDSKHRSTFIFWKHGALAGAESLNDRSFETKLREETGIIDGSLLGTLRRVFGTPSIGRRVKSAFVLDLDLKKLKKGDEYRVVVEELYDGERFMGFGEVVTAALKVGGSWVERNFVFYEGGGAFLPSEYSIHERPFYSPVEYMSVSSLFSPRRFHPIFRRVRPHRGIDFVGSVGEPIMAAQDGVVEKVVRVSRRYGAGRYVVIRHEDGYVSYYQHLNSVEEGLSVGLEIAAGTQIGTLGCSGSCTGAHLHFAVKKDGKYINPAQLIRTYPFRRRGQVMAADVTKNRS